ncbi:MAG: hypothetical protein O6945_02285 [Gammaproteobacteria bacterium]|nr:hypothetical protein [Gammaproteobacteria bacterium]
MKENLFKVLSTLAILVGLFLVAYELRQTKILTEAQLTSSYYSLVQQSRAAFFEEETLEALVKSCEEKPLNLRDAYVLDAYFTDMLSHVGLLVQIQRFGLAVDPKYSAKVQFGRVFSHEAGVRYWKTNREDYNPKMREYGDEILSKGVRTSCKVKLSEIIEDE